VAGTEVVFAMSAAECQAHGLFVACPGTTLSFSAGDRYEVEQVVGGFFTSTRYTTLWAPVAAIAGADRPDQAAAEQLRQMEADAAALAEEVLAFEEEGDEADPDELAEMRGEIGRCCKPRTALHTLQPTHCNLPFAFCSPLTRRIPQSTFRMSEANNPTLSMPRSASCHVLRHATFCVIHAALWDSRPYISFVLLVLVVLHL
jgi:hypothetical protein